jgi:hypothetical protein
VPGGEIREAAVLDLHPFGPPRGARGVDHIGELVQADAGKLRLAFRFRHVFIEEDDPNGIRGGRVPLGKEHGGPGILEDPGEPLLGVGGVERQKAPARLEHGEDRDQRLDRPAGQHGHRDLRDDSEREKMPGQPASLEIELAVGQADTGAGDGQGVRRFGGPERKGFVHAKPGGFRDGKPRRSNFWIQLKPFELELREPPRRSPAR